MNWREEEPDVTPITENHPQYSETYWSSEDEDENEEVTSKENENKKIKLSGGDNIRELHDKSKERKISAEVAQEKEKKDAANTFPKEEEDSSSYSKDEAMQPPFQEIVKHEPDISPGKERRLRAVYDTLSRTQTRADRPNTILFKGGITNLDDYPKDNDHPANSEKGMDANLEDI